MKIDIPEWPVWNNPAYPDTTAVNMFDHKDGECIAYVFDDDGRVHLAIQIGAAVIAAEHIPENYPSTSIAFYASIEMWKKAVKEVDWIVAGLQRGHLGFPACEIDEI